MKALRNLRFLLIIFAFVVIAGTVGFHVIEGWSYFDGFYMVLTTLTTIGYGETHPLSHAGRVFNIFMIVGGVGLLLVIVGVMTQAMLEFEFNQLFGRRKMQREIDHLKGHYIICGAGRVGRSVARELAKKPVPFVIIEGKPDKAALYESEFLTILGDATQESVLRSARIEHAVGLVAATTTDATNTYVVLTARSLNPKLKIIARASEEHAEKHMLTAGADSVISPYTFAGHRIAHALIRPSVMDFLEVALLRNQEFGLEIEEIVIGADSRYAGCTVRDSAIREEFDVSILAIKSEGAAMRYNPSPTDRIEPGDRLIVMGNPAMLRKLEGLAHAAR
ncbi:MAG TPA: potassium channel protein [Candidatus Acidoferrales bacterium]|nr:potassium channel protein [Candidatus Acidoferrales bacterium]